MLIGSAFSSDQYAFVQQWRGPRHPDVSTDWVAKDLSSKRPILGTLDQTGPDRVEANVLPLATLTLLAPKLMIMKP